MNERTFEIDPKAVSDMGGAARVDIDNEYIGYGSDVSWSTMIDFSTFYPGLSGGKGVSSVIIPLPEEKLPAKSFVTQICLSGVLSNGAPMVAKLVKKSKTEGANSWKPIDIHHQEFNLSGPRGTKTKLGFAQIPSLVNTVCNFEAQKIEATMADEMIRDLSNYPPSNIFDMTNSGVVWTNPTNNIVLLKMGNVHSLVNPAEKNIFLKLESFMRSEHAKKLYDTLINYIVKNHPAYLKNEEVIRQRHGRNVQKAEEEISEERNKIISELAGAHFRLLDIPYSDIHISKDFEKILTYQLKRIENMKSVLVDKNEHLALVFEGFDEAIPGDQMFQGTLTVGFLTHLINGS